MTSRHWKIFVAVAECGTMSQAARDLQITQPSISQAISEIEREYSVLLFERVGKRLYLTDTGRSFLPYTKRLLSMEDELDEFLRSAASRKQIRIGATVTVGTCLISPLVEELERRIPGIRTVVSVANTQIVENRLLSGELDVGLVEGLVRSPDLRWEPAICDELVFVCSRNHPFCGREQIALSDLTKQSLILREQGSGTRAQLESLLRLRGVAADVRWDCSSTEAILNAVARGHGVSVLSRRLVSDYARGDALWTATFSDADFSRTFSLTYYKDKLLTEEMLCFIEICKAFDSIHFE